MLNVFNIPKPQNGFVSVFPGFSGAATQWVTWEKPAGITMIRIICIGGGAGGGSGFPSATVGARGGGGGGSSGSVGTVQIPAAVLPDFLYVSAGSGGTGGASSTTVSNLGAGGTASVVSIAPVFPGAIYTLCVGFGGGAGTQAPTSSLSGVGGPAGALPAIASNILLAGLGTFAGFVGSTAANGGAAAGGAGAAVTYPTNGLLLSAGGGGGGGSTGAGGAVNAPASQNANIFSLFLTVSGGTNGAVAGNGRDGHERQAPLLSTGGSGGGANSGLSLIHI